MSSNFLDIDRSAYEKFHNIMFPSGNIKSSDVLIKKEDLVKDVIEQKPSTITMGNTNDNPEPSSAIPTTLSRKDRRYSEKMAKKAEKRESTRRAKDKYKLELKAEKERIKDIQKRQSGFTESDIARIEKVLFQG